MSRRAAVWLRVGLAYLVYLNASVGLWATLAPRSFYEDFPGGGRTWVSVDGPYNEHLVRDVGAWALGMAVVALVAAWLLTRATVIVAGAAIVVATLPHAIYHSRHSDVIGDASDKVASIGGLWLGVIVAAAVLVAGLRLRDPAPAYPST